MEPNLPAHIRHQLQTVILPSSTASLGLQPHLLETTPVRQYRFIYPAPTTGTLSYPQAYGRQNADNMTMRRENDYKKRPSMLSDFHLTSGSQIIQPLPTDAQLGPDQGKRSRLQEAATAGRSLQLDAKKVPLPAYTPQVEAISPTPDDQPSSSSSTNRDHILDRIGMIDHEIAVTESNLKKMLKRKQELEETASSGSGEVTPESASVAAQSGGLFEKIYAHTRRQAAAVHSKVASIGPPLEILPLNRQPRDIKELQEIREKNKTFRPKLIAYLRKIQRFKEIRERYLTDRYNQLAMAWRKKVERMEKHPKRIAKEQKYREVFEKVFPELKKQREERERAARAGILGPRAPVDDSMYFTSTGEAEEDERIKMRQNAVIPPMLLDSFTRSRNQYVNNNGLVRDPVSEHEYRYDLFKIMWTDGEKRIFKEKFIQYGKNFAAISFFLERKTTKDCVQYYYLTKKSENYKQLLRRKNTRRGKPYRPPQIPRPEDMEEAEAAESERPDSDTAREPDCICMVCKAKIDASNPGRILTRAVYEQYGIDAEASQGQNVRICQKCRLGIVRRKHSHCPIGTCTTLRRKVKPSRTFPPKWSELSDEERRAIGQEFQFTLDVTKCCGSCYKRLVRRCDMATSLDETLNEEELALAKLENWTEEEIAKLKESVVAVGEGNWAAVAEKLGKPAAHCRRQYLIQKQANFESKKALPPKVAQVPGIEEEEEEDEAANSDDEDATSAAENTGSKTVSPKPIVKDDGIVKGLETAVAVKLEEQEQPKPDVKGHVMPKSELTAMENQQLSRSRESLRSGDGDSCATLSADEGQSETEAGSKAAASKALHTIDERSKEPVQYLGMKRPAVPTTLAGTEANRGSIRPDALPPCQPYKPKSAHIYRLESEQRAKEAVANACSGLAAALAGTSPNETSQLAMSIASSLPRPVPRTPGLAISSTSGRFPIPTAPISVVSKSASTIPKPEPMENAQRPRMLPCRNTESPEVIEIVPPKSRIQIKAPSTSTSQLHAVDIRNRGSLTQGTPIVAPGTSGPLPMFAAPQSVIPLAAGVRQPPLQHSASTSIMTPIATRATAASAISSSMENLARANTPLATMSSSARNEELYGPRPASASKASRPSSSDPAQVPGQQQQTPRIPSTSGNLAEQQQQQQQQQLYQQLLHSQVLANEPYMRAKQMGLNEHQALAMYNAALSAAVRDPVGYAAALASQQQEKQQQAANSRQATPEFHLGGVPGHLQMKVQDNAQTLLALGLSGLDPATQAALLQQHFYSQQLEHQRRLEQQRLLEHQQRLFDHQRAMTVAAVAAAAAEHQQKLEQQQLHQQRLALDRANQERLHFEQERLHLEKRRQYHEKTKQEHEQQEYRRQLLEAQQQQQQIMEAAQRQSPLTVLHQSRGGQGATLSSHYQQQAAVKQAVPSGASLPNQPMIKQEVIGHFPKELWMSAAAAQQNALAARTEELQKQQLQCELQKQQQLQLQQQKAATAPMHGRKSIIQRNVSTTTAQAATSQTPVSGTDRTLIGTPSAISQQQQPTSTSTPPAAGIPTKGAMKEFPPALSSASASSTATVRTIAPETSQQMAAPYGAVFPIPVIGSRPPLVTNLHPPISVAASMKPEIISIDYDQSSVSLQQATGVEKGKKTTKPPISPAIPRSTPGWNEPPTPTAASTSSSMLAGASTSIPAIRSGKIDVNLVNLVDSIITKHHGEERNPTTPISKETSIPTTRFGFFSAPTPVAIRPKTEIPAIVPVSPPPCTTQVLRDQQRTLVETPPASTSISHRPPTSGISTGRPPTLFEYIGDIISSNYSTLENPPSPEAKLHPTQSPQTSSALPFLEASVPRPAAIPFEQPPIIASNISQHPSSRAISKTELRAPTKSEMFEYDLEPVSPPEQISEESNASQRSVPTPLMGIVGPSITLAAVVSPPSTQAPPVTTWVSHVQPPIVASPVVEDSGSMTKSGSPAAPPFMAWNVFTLPEASGSILPTAVAGLVPAEHRRGQQSHDWQASTSSNSAEDMESSRAVAALLETEMRPESVSARPPMVGAGGGGQQAMAAMRPCPVPTYEPLSDDES